MTTNYWDRQSNALNNVKSERRKQDEKWGKIPRGLSLSTWLTVLTEEVGEVAKAILEDTPISELRKEVIQVAAVAVAFVEELDNLTE